MTAVRQLVSSHSFLYFILFPSKIQGKKFVQVIVI
ncbi:hypothetical protein BACCAP_01376 [Pseudoflavonifractor capillosus ATCC 29799]|uniref:Uncharacterized protein n=1 Tax=Pseudoflavonifractor capillosus ATCC 29799 TaxID=411467 RepID=A6NT47_9FIRM|nr:hypothetical protein BACCAP_01376 [Pseudoflavonifractor capillosus ATCC 29799]